MSCSQLFYPKSEVYGPLLEGNNAYHDGSLGKMADAQEIIFGRKNSYQIPIL